MLLNHTSLIIYLDQYLSLSENYSRRCLRIIPEHSSHANPIPLPPLLLQSNLNYFYADGILHLTHLISLSWITYIKYISYKCIWIIIIIYDWASVIIISAS